MATPSGLRPAFRSLMHHLAHDHTEPSRLAAAVALGLFLGATPLYGLHLALCVSAAVALRLNVLVVYLAANISNPLVAPFLVWSELVIGHTLLGRDASAFALDHLKERIHESPTAAVWDLVRSVSLPLFVGSAVLGAALAAVGGLATWVSVRRWRARRAKGSEGDLATRLLAPADGGLATALLATTAAARRLGSRFEQGYVRGKLRADPVFRAVARLVPLQASVADVGCGRGLALALLRHAGHGGRFWGCDWDPARLATAHVMLQAPAGPAWDGAVGLHRLDVRQAEPPMSDAVLLIDVLHYLPVAAQGAVLDRCVSAVLPGGLLLLRDMDGSPGRTGRVHRLQERVTTALGMNRGERVAPPDLDRLCAGLVARRFSVERLPLAGWSGSTDTLIVARAPSGADLSAGVAATSQAPVV